MNRNYGIAILVAMTMLLGSIVAWAQSDQPSPIRVGETDIIIRPLSDVTESAPVTLDITDTTARVNFIGTEALACYLIYGTDTTFGDVTNDPDMAQAAIVEHNPIMINLEPDTEYVYRLQGVGEDGVMYVSDLYRFRTLPAQTTGNDNLLSPVNGARVVGVSSNFGGGPNDGRWGILNALDNNAATEWSSNGDGDDAYFEVDLGEIRQITEISYQTRSMRDGTAITTAFTVTSDDETVHGPFELPSADEPYRFEVNISTTMLRFDVESSTGGNTGIVDVAAFGTPGD